MPSAAAPTNSRASVDHNGVPADPGSPTLGGADRDADAEVDAEKQPAGRPPMSGKFLDKTPQAAASRAAYLKAMVGGIVAISIAIFAVFSIYWGSVWSSPRHSLPGWVVDFDGGFVGQTVSHAMSQIVPTAESIKWTVVPASQFPGGVKDVAAAIVDEKVWYAVTINAGASTNLTSAVSSANAAYNSSAAFTFLGSEARNENIYAIHYSIILGELENVSNQFALSFLKNISSSDNLSQILSNAPQIVSRPIYFTTVNLRPFDVPVAAAVTFVGLIYLIILTFFITNVSFGARAGSRLEGSLTLRSLIRLRLVTAFIAYFFVSLFYTLLSRAFQLPFNRHFGSAGFVIFWMLNFIGMLAVGLALEAMFTLLTIRFVPFFLILWIISNVAVAVYPIDVLPHVYRYGYGFPVYNISRAVRAIVFGTKNELGLNFGVCIAWVGLSSVTIMVFQWMRRREAVRAAQKAN